MHEFSFLPMERELCLGINISFQGVADQIQEELQRRGFLDLHGPFEKPEEHMIDDPIVSIPEIKPSSDRQAYEVKSPA